MRYVIQERREAVWRHRGSDRFEGDAIAHARGYAARDKTAYRVVDKSTNSIVWDNLTAGER